MAAEQYPNGLPEPHSDDPTQWLFKGTVVGSEAPLQVAVARLLGYRWPDQEPDALDAFADPDGIVCLPSVAATRLPLNVWRLLTTAYGADWGPPNRIELLAAAGRQGDDPRRLAARRVLRAACPPVPQPPLHLADLGRTT